MDDPKDQLLKNFFNVLLEKEYLEAKEDDSKPESLNFEDPFLFGTPLHLECRKKQPSLLLIKSLVENKNDVNAKDRFGNTALKNACSNETIEFEVIKFLVDQKSELANNKANQNSPLHCACSNEKLDFRIISYLIEKKSQINKEGKYQNTPFHRITS